MKNLQPTNTHEVFPRECSIFFEPPKTKEQVNAECLKKAKLELISNVLDIRRTRGIIPTGSDFDELWNYDLDSLHNQIIQEQDKTYFNSN